MKLCLAIQKLQMAHLISLKTINVVSYNKFSKSLPRRAGYVLGFTMMMMMMMNHVVKNYKYIDAMGNSYTNIQATLLLFQNDKDLKNRTKCIKYGINYLRFRYKTHGN